MEKRDPMLMYKGAKTPKITTDTKRHHYEADLHLSFCKWVKKKYPTLLFTRHERERKRGFFDGQAMKVYNSIDGLPDWEGLIPVISGPFIWCGIYIEFKKPTEKWIMSDGETIKPEYEHQHRFHIQSWKINRPAYFCNNLETAKLILVSYLSGSPLSKQVYIVRSDKKQELLADMFFGDK